MKALSLFEIFKNSVKYTLSDWMAVIILGVILTLLSFLNDFNYYDNLFLGAVIWILIMILSLIEIGYSYKIIEETLKGSQKPPLFNNFKELLIHGIKDITVYLYYILLVGAVLFCLIGIINLIPESFIIAIIISMIIIGLLFLLLLTALINLANHNGQLIHAFHIGEIFLLLRKIGIKRIIMIYILTLIVEYLLIKTFTSGELFVDITIGNLIRSLIVTPFIMIFTERAIALSAVGKI